MRLVGGNIEPSTSGGIELQALKGVTKRVGPKIKYRFPGMDVAKAIILGMVINAWVYRAMVNIPGPGMLMKVRAKISGTIKYSIGMENMVPKWVVYGPAKWGALGWYDPEVVLMKRVMSEWVKVLNSNNRMMEQVVWYEYEFGRTGIDVKLYGSS